MCALLASSNAGARDKQHAAGQARAPNLLDKPRCCKGEDTFASASWLEMHTLLWSLGITRATLDHTGTAGTHVIEHESPAEHAVCWVPRVTRPCGCNARTPFSSFFSFATKKRAQKKETKVAILMQICSCIRGVVHHSLTYRTSETLDTRECGPRQLLLTETYGEKCLCKARRMALNYLAWKVLKKLRPMLVQLVVKLLGVFLSFGCPSTMSSSRLFLSRGLEGPVPLGEVGFFATSYLCHPPFLAAVQNGTGIVAEKGGFVHTHTHTLCLCFLQSLSLLFVLSFVLSSFVCLHALKHRLHLSPPPPLLWCTH